MRQMSVAVGMLACVLVGCADSTSTQLAPTGPRDVSIQLKPALTAVVSAHEATASRGSTGMDRAQRWSSTSSNSISAAASESESVRTSHPGRRPRSGIPARFTGTRIGFPRGRVQATLYDKKGNVLANTGWVSVGFDCI